MSNQNISVIDPTVFTDAQGAKELQSNAIRKTLTYDAYGGQSEFDVIVLTKPVPMATSDAAAVFGSAGQTGGIENNSADPLAGGIQFKGRIIGNGFISPHASIPNPCNLDTVTTGMGTAIKIINMHTTFASAQGYTGKIPNIGDTVKVKLHTGDIKFNLQYAVFSKISNSADGASAANVMSAGCSTLESAFQNFDPDEDLETSEINYSTINEGAGAAKISREAAEPIIQAAVAQIGDYITDPDYVFGVDCGYPDGFSSRSATPERIAAYPKTKCVTATIGGGTVKGHPKFIETLKKIIASSGGQSWNGDGNGIKINSNSLSRGIEDQIFLRMNNCGARTVAAVYAATKCNPPTARPGSSRHQMGLAIDFSGRIAASSPDSNVLPGVLSDAAKWLASNARAGVVDTKITNASGGNAVGNGTFDIQRLYSESWHWSVDGG